VRRHEYPTLAAIGGAGVLAMLAGVGVVRCDVAAAPPVIGELAVPADHPESARGAGGSTKAARLPIALPAHDPGPANPTEHEARLVALANRCSLAGPRPIRPAVALAMLRQEDLAGVPDALRGVTLGAWCGEAALGLGDEICRTGPCDGGRAKGPLQLHAGLARMCVGLPYGGPATPEADAVRETPVLAARCFLGHVVRVLDRTPCRGLERWTYAEAWIARGRRPADCRVASSHVRRLRRWTR